MAQLGTDLTEKRKQVKGKQLKFLDAKVAELVDAQDSGSCGVTPVGVRLPSFAPEKI